MNLGAGRRKGIPPSPEMRDQLRDERTAGFMATFERESGLFGVYGGREQADRDKQQYMMALRDRRRARKIERRYARQAYRARMDDPRGAIDLSGRDTGNMQQLIDEHYAREDDRAGAIGDRQRMVQTPSIDVMMGGGTSASWSFMSFNFFSRLRQQVKDIIPD